MRAEPGASALARLREHGHPRGRDPRPEQRDLPTKAAGAPLARRRCRRRRTRARSAALAIRARPGGPGRWAAARPSSAARAGGRESARSGDAPRDACDEPWRERRDGRADGCLLAALSAGSRCAGGDLIRAACRWPPSPARSRSGLTPRFRPALVAAIASDGISAMHPPGRASCQPAAPAGLPRDALSGRLPDPRRARTHG